MECDICVCAFKGTRFWLLESVSWILISLWDGEVLGESPSWLQSIVL